jgi:predicted nucleic acid-binding protein
MIVLDTNVVSELMRPRPHPAVVEWVDAQITEGAFITSVTAAELLFGVERLPRGQRRATLENALGEMLDFEFCGRILAFDALSAIEYARVVIDREAAGRPISMADAMIAASTLGHGIDRLATRNVSDFADTGVELVDPWAVCH